MELPLENPVSDPSGSSKIGQLMPRHSFIFINQSMSFTTGELMDPESRAGRQGQVFPVQFWTCTAIPSGLFGLIPFHSLSPSPLCPWQSGADLWPRAGISCQDSPREFPGLTPCSFIFSPVQGGASPCSPLGFWGSIFQLYLRGHFCLLGLFLVHGNTSAWLPALSQG